MSELKVNKVTPRSGTTVSLGDSGDSVAIPSGVGFNGFGYRNIIINGDMSIAQRGTSFSSISSGNSTYPVDRFRTNIDTAGTWTISQDTTVPTGQGFAKSFKMDCTTANASLSAGSFIVIQQLVEAQNLQYLKFGTSSAESLTLSFWVKSNKTGTYICEINSSDSNRAFSKSYTIDVTDTWEKKTITYPGDTTGVINNDNGVGLEFNFWLAAGSTYSSGSLQTSWGTRTNANMAPGQVNLADDTANEWYITGVQLEAGTTASDFEFLPVDVNLQRCQRYFQKIDTTSDNQPYSARTNGTTDIVCALMLPTSLRASPTLNNPNFAFFNSSSSATSSGGSTSVTKITNSNSLITILKSGFTGLTSNRSCISGPVADLTIDSEL